MTDTTKPPNRPTSSRPRPFGRDGKPERGGEAPRGRASGERDAPARRDDHRRDEGRRDPSAKTRGTEPAPPKDDARIAKVMARAGLCSRRDAEGWIAAGRVAVNGTVIDSPALNVKPGDRITVDDVPLPEREQTRLFMFHKPRGLVTTARDPEGRPTIFDNLPEGLPRVVSVGRLDINTEGLMLLTNDGGLARVLELPATGWMRRYRVRANGTVDQAQLDALKNGVTLDGVDYAGIEATLDRVQGANVWLTMGLREGKNREIKRVLESLGLAVTRLIRLSFGPFQLGELGEGAVESVPARVLREQLGPGLAAQAGVDLEIREEPAPGRSRRPEGVAGARPSRSDPNAPRPHVGALRAAREEEAGEGRKRIQRGATADRKGRSVAVERVLPVRSAEGTGTSRNARRFAAEKQDARVPQRTRADAAGAPKRFGAARPVRGGDRPERSEDFAARPRTPRTDREGFAAEKQDARAPQRTRTDAAGAPKRFGAARPVRGGDRPERGEGFAARPRTPRADGESFAAKPRAPRTDRESFAARPRAPRADGESFPAKPRAARAGRDGEGFAARPRAERAAPARADDTDRSAAPPRRDRPEGSAGRGRDDRGTDFGAKRKSFGEAPSNDRPRSGKPNGRPGGFGSERPATGRNKPSGGRPDAARPPGGKPFGAKPFDGRPSGGRPAGGKPSGGKPSGGRPSGGKPRGTRP